MAVSLQHQRASVFLTNINTFSDHPKEK